MRHVLLATLQALAFFAEPSEALPRNFAGDNFGIGNNVFNASDYFSFKHGEERKLHGVERRDDEERVKLRIMPFGASIMSGYGASDGAGLRKHLRASLRADGWEVNMVGSLRAGEMVDNNHEAVPGNVITDIQARVKTAVTYKPNVIIINGGTNDANFNLDIPQAGLRMRRVLNDLWAGKDMADACIMLSTLIPTSEPTGARTRLEINAQYRSLVSELYSTGKCIYLADMDPVTGPGSGWIRLPQDFDPNETVHIHPNDEGHRKMASVFKNAILRASKKFKPAKEITVSPNGCDKQYGNGVYAGALTQQGSGTDDGIYYHESLSKDIVLNITSEWDRNQWRFARLFSRDYDDLVAWYEKSTDEHVYAVWKNLGSEDKSKAGQFRKIDDMFPKMFCRPAGVRFIDMNADGLDDLVCINADGVAYQVTNDGKGSGNTPPGFKSHSTDKKIKDSEGYPQARVVLADIDGDGRGDYGIIDDGGNVHFWRNGGVGDVAEYWQALGLRFAAKGMGDVRGTRFEDINGDGRDDWLWVSDVGQTTTWTNSRSCAQGKIGDGLYVAWRQGFLKGQTSGPTHNGMADYAKGDEKYLRDRIHFARIFGVPQDFGLLGQQDYVFMEHKKRSDGKHQFLVRVWQNKGHGGTKMKPDGNKYCNMMGHENGAMDYVWTWKSGKMVLYPNAGKTSIKTGESWWGPVVDPIWTPPHDMDRRDLHLVDWDGDGACDIVWTNPSNVNRIGGVWINNYKRTKRWDWTSLGVPASAAKVQCSFPRGLAVRDDSVRMADLTGNGRGDFTCMQPDGRMTAFVHNGDDSWEWLDQVKFTEKLDRANYHLADVNGDGKADLIWTDKFDGNARVWYNEGRASTGANAGSSMHWRKVEQNAYDGNVGGTCMYYPDLDGNGRADMHAIKGTYTNEAETWLNPSCGLTDVEGDDPNGATDPKLPIQPGAPSIGDGSGDGSGDGDDEGPAEGSGVVYIGGDVWKNGDLQCYEPAVVVLPPTVLPKPVTISVGKYTTSFKVGTKTSTVTIDVPVITTTIIAMYNEPIKAGETRGHVIQPVPSVTFPPVKVSVGGQTRTVTLPPWPHITMGPPESWTTDPKLGPELIGNEPNAPPEDGQTTSTDIGGVLIPTLKSATPVKNSQTPEPVRTDIEWAWESGVAMVEPKPEDEDEDDDDDQGLFVWIPCNAWFFNLCVDVSGLKIKRWKIRFPIGSIGPGPPPPPALKFKNWKIEGKLPPWPKITNPPGPGPKKADYPDPPDNCDMSTASICSTLTSRSVEVVDGTSRTVDEIVSSTCHDIVGCFVRDLEVDRETENPACTPDVVLPGLRMAMAKNKAPKETSASFSSSIKGSESASRTSSANIAATSAASTKSRDTSQSTSQSYSGPSPASSTALARGESNEAKHQSSREESTTIMDAEDTDDETVSAKEKFENTAGSKEKRGSIHKRSDQDSPAAWVNDERTFINKCKAGNYEIFPREFGPTPNIINRLRAVSQHLEFEVVASKAGSTNGYTAFITVRNLPDELANSINQMSEVGATVGSKSYEYVKKQYGASGSFENLMARRRSDLDTYLEDKVVNVTLAKRVSYDGSGQAKRTLDWGNAYLSTYPGIFDWWDDAAYVLKNGEGQMGFAYHYNHRQPARGPGTGQIIYFNDRCIVRNHEELSPIDIIGKLEPKAVFPDYPYSYDNCAHGTAVLSRIAGKDLGLASSASVVLVPFPNGAPYHTFLQNLVDILDDLQFRGRDHVYGKVVMNLSMGMPRNTVSAQFEYIYGVILRKLIQDFGMVFVTSAGNQANGGKDAYGNERNILPADDMWPNAYVKGDDLSLKSILVVGAVNAQGSRAGFSQAFANDDNYDSMVHAPGVRVLAASDTGGFHWEYGTSPAAGTVTGLVAYFRALPGMAYLQEPGAVQELVRSFQALRYNEYEKVQHLLGSSDHHGWGPVLSVWNGQIASGTEYDKSCLDPDSGIDQRMYNGICKQQGFDDVGAPGGGGNNDGGSGGGGNGNGGSGWPKRLTWSKGSPSPTCSGDGCGAKCEGHYCVTRPGRPPVFTDPANNDDDNNQDKEKACKECREDLKDTYCPVNSNWKSCVWNQCQKHSSCSTCGVICEDEVNKLPDPTGGDPGNVNQLKVCNDCRSNLKDTYCPVNSNWKSCVWNQCQKDSDCSACNITCEDQVNKLPDPTGGDPGNVNKLKVCSDCRFNLEYTYCPVNSLWKECVLNQCKKDSDCNACGNKCEDKVGRLDDPTK